MKKLFTTALFIFLCLGFCKAQYVLIPDGNFVNWLNTNGYGAALDSNQLDTTNSLVMSATTVDCHQSNIYSLEGIEYFKNLDTLICGDNYLTFLQWLPSHVVNLRCYNNYIDSLPALPSTLTYLDCSGNNISVLPNLFSSLKHLECGFNQLTTLPALSANLVFLNCYDNFISDVSTVPSTVDTFICYENKLTALPNLLSFASLKYLDCSYNQITGLSNLPDSLTYLDCTGNQLNSLPTLPDSLIFLDVWSNNLASLPALPQSLYNLIAGHNKLTNLPTLPNRLWALNCDFNQLLTLPSLPATLQQFGCSNNNISTWPLLPLSLIGFDCSFNQLTVMPSLPANLAVLVCQGNKLTTLSLLPASPVEIICNNNRLTDLPYLPLQLEEFIADSNPGLHCLPPFETILPGSFTSQFSIAGTGIKCLPNVIQHSGYIAAIDTMPICDFSNINGCQSAWNIKGQVVKDLDGNCATLNDGAALQNVSVKLYDSSNHLLQQEYINGAGNYSFNTHTGIFTVKADTTGLPFTIICPTDAFKTDTLTTIDSLDYNADFRFYCKPNYDIGVNAISSSSAFFPNDIIGVPIFAGDEAIYYGVHCNTNGISGTVTATISGPVSIISASNSSIATSTINGNIVTWTVSDFSTVNFKNTFWLNLHTNISAQAGQQVCISVNITTSGVDNNSANDTLTECFTVVNSHDPNDKEVNPSGAIAPGYDGYLTYTIHFQNTGTAAAQNIQIVDTISNNLDISTFQLVAFSQQGITQVFDNSRVVKFSFPNINLPDSTSDNANSVGYVQYKIKPIANLQAGNSINNTAYIYFDFNSPVVTNTTSSVVQVATGTEKSMIPVAVNLFPNPVSRQLTVSSNQLTGSKMELSDVLGRTIFVQTATGNKATIDVRALTPGVYFLHIRSAGMDEVRKFVKE